MLYAQRSHSALSQFSMVADEEVCNLQQKADLAVDNYQGLLMKSNIFSRCLKKYAAVYVTDEEVSYLQYRL